MAIIEAYKRGFRRGIQAASEIAGRRMAVCAEAVTIYERDGKQQAAATERCAQREAEYIWQEILKLKPAE